MRLLNWFFKTTAINPPDEPMGPPLPHPAGFFDRSYQLPGEGVVTVIGYHTGGLQIGGLQIGGRHRLRVQNKQTGEICQVPIEYLLANGTEVEFQPVEGTTREGLDPDVERIIAFQFLQKEEGEIQ